MSSAQDIIALIRKSLPEAAVIAGGGIDEIDGELFAEEERLIANAGYRRRREFRAGRLYARRALAEVGRAPSPILASPERFPIWTPGIVGTISHTDEICLVIVAPARELAGIGLDVEKDTPLDEDLIDLICRDEEIKERFPSGGNLPKLIFVIKEAVFKLYNPITRIFLEFKDVVVAVDPETGTFHARLANDERPSCLGCREWRGKFGHGHGMLFACVYLKASE